MILCKVSQTAISKAVCYKTKNEQLREKAVHFLLVAINCFCAGLPTVFCTITLLPDGMTLEILHESVLVAVADRDMRSVAHEDDRALDFLDLMHIDHI